MKVLYYLNHNSIINNPHLLKLFNELEQSSEMTEPHTVFHPGRRLAQLERMEERCSTGITIPLQMLRMAQILPRIGGGQGVCSELGTIGQCCR